MKETLTAWIEENCEPEYKEFSKKFTFTEYPIKGVRLPKIKNYAKTLVKSSINPDDIIPMRTKLMAVISGVGNYSGSIFCAPYIVVGTDISKATVKIADYQYTGKAITPNISDMLITLKVDKDTVFLDENDVEIVGFENNIKKGTAKVILHGIYSDDKGYGGFKTVSFKIVSKAMGYTIKYDKNAPEASGTMKSSIVAPGGQLAANKYTCPNKTFDYWSTSPEYNNEDYDAALGIVHYKDKGTYLGNLSSVWNRVIYGTEVTMYAHWK